MFFLNITPGSPNKSCYCSVREGSETPTGGLTSLGSHSAPIHGLLRTLLSPTSSLPLVKKKKKTKARGVLIVSSPPHAAARKRELVPSKTGARRSSPALRV